MEFLRTISKDPRIEAKVAHYDAIDGVLEIVLHNSDKGRHPSTKAQDGYVQVLDREALRECEFGIIATFLTGERFFRAELW
jgi:hypothetical protein